MTELKRSTRKLVFCLCGLLASWHGISAAAVEEENLSRLATGETEAGRLLMRTEGDGLVAAPLLRTAVRMRVTGLINRTTVRQQFENASDQWVEAIYVFPLPENAAVDHLRMEIGGRLVEGVVKERQAAKKAYTKAKAAGKRASLVTQERPNVFTTAVANIGPRETVSVEIEYQHLLAYAEGRFEIRFPLVIGPRFIPGTPKITRFSGTGWAANTKEVVDAARITPPVVEPGRPKLNPVTIRLELQLGIPLDEIKSLYHPIDVQIDDALRYEVKLAAPDTPADRDFVVRFRPRAGLEPTAALFAEKHGGYEYGLLMLTPPRFSSQTVLPRQVSFVIDTSGSMDGSSILQAKRALVAALAQLEPRDRFNLIQFNSRTSSLYARPMPVSADTLGQGRAYIDRLEAGGGTVMAPALAQALAPPAQEGSVRQVVFITDGNVGNEDALFDRIKTDLGDARLFTVGIGSAPNSHFMRGAARYGRGGFTHIGAIEEVQSQMDRLFHQITSPMLHEIALQWDNDVKIESWPQRIPDLYAGEPMLLSMRAEKLPARVAVSGKIAGRLWRTEVQLRGGQGRRGVHVLWARRKIRALMEQVREGAGALAGRRAVVETALAHHLASRYTSLVAVDVTPARPRVGAANTINVPTNLPAGWNHAKVFGRLPRTATPAMAKMLGGAALLLVSAVLFVAMRRWAPRRH